MVLCTPAWAKKPQPVALPVERQQQFSYYWYAAKQAITEDRYTDALVLLEFCEALNPQDGTTLSFLGILYEGAGQSQRALDAFRRAFEADPRDQWFRYSRALLNQRTEEGFRQALAVLEKAEKLNSSDEDLLEQLGRMYFSSGQWKKALQTQDKLDRLKGYDGYSAINRYRIYSMWQKPKKAAAEIEKYLAQDPANIQYLPSLILNNHAYYMATHKGDLKKAEQMSERTIREQPNNPVYLDTYGWIMHLQGQDELALFYLRKALWYTTDETRAEIERHIQLIENSKKK
ncbi:MAG: hypothetical protein IJS82_06980 [Paludibacteraceae bacterium]|nr:hypothetical protein [Paludibacteraceae bacterium]